MSWTQGIQLREELPQKFIDFCESMYARTYNEKGHLEYITWFDFEDWCFADFGNEKSLKIALSSNGKSTDSDSVN